MQVRLLQQPACRVYCILFVLFIIISLPAKAQRRSTPGMNADGDVLGGSSYNSGGSVRQDGWAIAITGGYEAPLGDLKEVYKGAPAYGATVTRRMGNLVYSGTIDYRSYKPKQSSFSYNYDDVNYLTATYSNYNGTGLYLGLSYEVPLGGFVDIYGGVNGGYIFVKYNMAATDGTNVFVSESVNNSTTYLGPKLGFNCAISGKASIGVEGKYTLGTIGANYNSREGSSVTKSFNSYAANLFLVYNF